MNHIHNSLWSDTATLPNFPQLNEDITTDVLVIGGGMAGILCTYLLAQAGVNVILAEANTIGSGITGNTTAKLTSQHGLIYSRLAQEFGWDCAKGYFAANEQALAKYRMLCAQIDCDFEEQDAYVYTTAHPKKLEQELRTLDKLKAGAEFVQDIPLPVSVQGAIRFKQQAQFHPLKFIAGIADSLPIYEHTKVLSYDGRYFHTEHNRISAKKTIVTTHFPMFNKHGGYFLKLYQHRSYVVALENAPDINGMYVDENEYGLSFRSHGNLLLMGGGAHRTGKHGGGWDALSALAKKYYPDAKEAYRWAAQDCMTLDGIPYIGQYAKNTPNLYVATGFNKWGMTSAMAAAQILTDLVQEKENPYAEWFCPSRSILRPQLVSNVLESTANLLTFTKPRCPHMGCALKWNAQEHSWDCPCHGSRFDARGGLLDTPANSDIKLNS